MRHLLLFIVLLALLPAIVFSQATIQVAPGTNAISAAVANASSGDILELGEGVFIEQNTVVIDKALIIRAKAGLSTKPVWQVEWVVGADSTQLMMKVLDHFWLDGIKLDGKTVAGDTIQSGLLVDKDTKVGQNITLTNCEFVNYLDLAIYAEDSQANNVVIKFCTFAHIPGERGGVGTINWFFDDATTDGSNFSIVNSTIYDTYGRSIYIKANSEMDLLVDHVTIAVDTTGNWGEKTIEYRGVKAIIRNSIITCYPDSANSHGIRLGSAESIVEYIYAGPFVTSRGFWKDKGDFVHPEENILNYDETILTFTDPDNGDFSYPDWQDAYIYGKDEGGNDTPLGDLRAFDLVDTTPDFTPIYSQTTIPVAAGTNAISAAVAGASSGDILELGAGTFIEQDTVVINRAITIMAAAGLEDNLPVWQIEWFGTDTIQNMIQLKSSLILDGIKLSGITVGGDTIQSALIADATATPHLILIIQYCEFVNFQDMAIYGEDALAKKVLIQTTTFAHIPGARGGVGTVNWFYNDTTGSSTFTMTNCLIYDTYGRSIYVKTPGVLDFLVDHVTIAVDTTGNWGEKVIEYRGVKAMIRNSIITCYPDSANSHGIRLGSVESIVEYIYAGPFISSRGFWKDKGDFVHSDDNILYFDETILTFTDPDNGDFSYPDWQDAYTYGMDKDGNAIPLGDLRPWGLVNAIDDEGIVHVPTKMQLHQNYPNPFNPQTTIGFNLPVAGQVSLTVYNTIGQKIVTLVDQQMKAGQHSVTWNASSVSSGIYFYKIQMDNRVQVRKMVLLK